MARPVPTAEASRRLDPILDALFAPRPNPRAALKLATHAEAKRPLWPSARALRALALRRLGRAPDADTVAAAAVRDIVSGAAVDADAGNKLHLFYREAAGREADSALAFELVAATDGDWEGVFVWWMRAGAFDRAGKVATRLQKALGARYALWRALALWLGNRRKGAAVMKNIVAALVKKGMHGGGEPDAVRFAVRVLCDVGDFDAARVVLEEARGMGGEELGLFKADVEYQMGDKPRVESAYRSLLESGDGDDWVCWLRLLEVADAAVVREVAAKVEEKDPKLRGPHLALLEVCFRGKDWAALREGVNAYFANFGAKRVCCDDLRPYLAALEAAETGAGADVARNLVAGIEDGDADKAVRCLHASWLRLWMGCLHESPEELVACYEAMLVDPLESTERQPGDDYILLAAHKILPPISSREGSAEAADRYADPAKVLQAVALVEKALEESPHNFDFNLLAALLYKSIGAGHFAADKWEALDAKHIQTATLGHLIVEPMLELGVHIAFLSIDEMSHRLWTECDRDLPESVSRALRDEKVNAATEFFEFGERVRRSRSLVRSMLTSALAKLNGVDGKEALGVHEAWSVLSGDSRTARFVVGDFPLETSGPFIANEDLRCMDFWELDQFDPERCRKDLDAPGAQDGVPISSDEQTLLLVEFLSLRCLARLVAEKESSGGDLEALKVAWHSLSEAAQSAASSQAYVVGMILGEGDARSAVCFLEDELAALQSKSVAGGLAPGSFARAGRLVYISLTLTSMALGGMRKARALIYRKAALSACTGLEALSAVVADDETYAGWMNSWASEDAEELVTICHRPSAELLRKRARAIRLTLKMRAL